MLKRNLSKSEISTIIRLYSEKQYSLRKIAKELLISRGVIRKALINANTGIRSNYISLKLTNTKHQKTPFSGDINEKAYILGLVKGDLTPIKKSKQTLRLTVASTHKSFLNYVKTVFEKYGPVHIYPTKDKDNYKWNMSIDLDFNSFSFLLEAREQSDFEFNDESLMWFLAGFIDTDGSIYIRKTGRYAQFIIRMFGQDKKLLELINKKLYRNGYHPNLYISAKKGEVRKSLSRTIVYNKDYYILELSRKKEVIKLMNSLPLQHPEKIARKKILGDLSNKRVTYREDVEEMAILRGKIKEKVKKDIKEAETKYLKRKK